MSFNAAQLTARLTAAANDFDRETVSQLCQELVAELRQREKAYPAEHAGEVLAVLRRKRHFDLLQRVADNLIQSGSTEPRIKRQYAQSLIDQGNLTAALSVLRQLLDATTENLSEHYEARGLIGRVYKQLYIDSRADHWRHRALLENAVRAYYGVYREDPQQIWHGINTVALLRLAERRNIGLRGAFPAAAQIADEILELIARKQMNGPLEIWDEATAMEAYVALDQGERALEWMDRYTDHAEKGHSAADAFEYASTYRQLTEIWELTPSSPIGARILPPLLAALLKRQGGEVELLPRETQETQRITRAMAEDKHLEKILGKDSFVRLGWLVQALDRAKAVARIENQIGKGIGSGFLIRGKELTASYGDELLLLTNAHVMAPEPAMRSTLLPQKAVITFEAAGIADRKVAEVLASSPPRELDFTLVRLEPPIEEIEPCPLTPDLPVGEDDKPIAEQHLRVYVIGHPGGGKLSFSIHDSLLLDYDHRLLHYRTPTAGGSSGSPVFNEEWEMIGLHHAGGEQISRLHGQTGYYSANEGIWIEAIRQALAKKKRRRTVTKTSRR